MLFFFKIFRLKITPVPSPNSSQTNKNVTFDNHALTPYNVRRGIKRKHVGDENDEFKQVSKSYSVIFSTTKLILILI